MCRGRYDTVCYCKPSQNVNNSLRVNKKGRAEKQTSPHRVHTSHHPLPPSKWSASGRKKDGDREDTRLTVSVPSSQCFYSFWWREVSMAHRPQCPVSTVQRSGNIATPDEVHCVFSEYTKYYYSGKLDLKLQIWRKNNNLMVFTFYFNCINLLQ